MSKLFDAPPPAAFSSLAVATGNQADSRGSLISVDSNLSNSDRNSEKMDGCEKVRTIRRSARPRSRRVLHRCYANARPNCLRRGNCKSGVAVCVCWQFARPQSLIGYGSRCDKLDQAETRSLLMCFLHIMKTISEGMKLPERDFFFHAAFAFYHMFESGRSLLRL